MKYDIKSSILTVKVTHEKGFVNLECLKKALSYHNLSNEFEIVQQENRYYLSSSDRANQHVLNQVKSTLSVKLNDSVTKILPKYVEYVAIHEYSSKGFK